MSWRVSLDVDPWPSADFIVGRDGDMAEAVKGYAFQRPLKIIYRDDAALACFVDAYVTAYGGDESALDEISAVYHVAADGKTDRELSGKEEIRAAVTLNPNFWID